MTAITEMLNLLTIRFYVLILKKKGAKAPLSGFWASRLPTGKASERYEPDASWRARLGQVLTNFRQ